VPLVLVYLPSVLSVYALASDASAQTVDRRPAVHPAAAVTQRSDVIAGRVARIAQARGVGFVDTRPRLRAAAAEAPVHGPRDWRHFNRRGYEALADAVASHLVCAQRNRTGECVAWGLTPAARLEASPCVASRAG